jgi:two-component system, NtrC family, sensor kinase
MPASPLRWWNRLSFKVTAVITLTTAVGGAMFLWVVLRAERNLLMEQTLSNAAFLSDTLVSSLDRHMLRNEREELLGSLQAVAAQPLMAELRLFDAHGLTHYSMDPEEIGRIADTREPTCAACHHSSGRPPEALTVADRNRIIQHAGGRVLVTVSPIYNRPTCSSAACHAHPPEQRVLGLLEVGTSLANVDDTLLALQRTTGGIALLTILGLATVSIMFTRRAVVRPLERLAEGVHRVKAGDLKEEVPVQGSGEIAELAQAFNEMEAALLDVRRQRLALLEGLEQKVEERTAALKRAQEVAIQSEKLSSLGRLAASVAHEINNPLAGILTYAKLLVRMLEEAPPDEKARARIIGHLKLVERETQRCTAIVRHLLDFARERQLTLTQVDLNVALGEAVFLISNQVTLQNITLEHEPGDVPPVAADFGQIRQAFVNILINACDAMTHGGTLRVRSRRAEDGTAEVIVQDTGSGIPPEHLKQILDPFFTTKEKGTGLGLSVVYGIVERHGGKLRIDSTPGVGTTVVIALPAVEAAAPAPASAT